MLTDGRTDGRIVNNAKLWQQYLISAITCLYNNNNNLCLQHSCQLWYICVMQQMRVSMYLFHTTFWRGWPLKREKTQVYTGDLNSCVKQLVLWLLDNLFYSILKINTFWKEYCVFISNWRTNLISPFSTYCLNMQHTWENLIDNMNLCILWVLFAFHLQATVAVNRAQLSVIQQMCELIW